MAENFKIQRKTRFLAYFYDVVNKTYYEAISLRGRSGEQPKHWNRDQWLIYHGTTFLGRFDGLLGCRRYLLDKKSDTPKEDLPPCPVPQKQVDFVGFVQSALDRM
jgi:hypothetical protein